MVLIQKFKGKFQYGIIISKCRKVFIKKAFHDPKVRFSRSDQNQLPDNNLRDRRGKKVCNVHHGKTSEQEHEHYKLSGD